MARSGDGRAVVIGAGLSGLAAGFKLASDGWDVLLLEKEQQVGGRCRTVSAGGFRFDVGAQYFHDSYDSTLKTAIRLGLGDRFRIPDEPKGFFHRGSVIHFTARSRNPAGLLPWAVIGLRDAFSVALHLVRGYRGYNIRFPAWWKEGDGVCAREFLSKRASARFMEDMAVPVSSYAMGAGLSELSAAGFMIALRYTFGDRTGCLAGGLGILPEALGRKVRIVAGMEAVGVVAEGERVRGVRAVPAAGGRARTYRADAVVCAVPAPLVGSAVGGLDPVMKRIVWKTLYSPHVTVNMGFEGDVCTEAGPILFPGPPLARVSWLSTSRSRSLECAPEGCSAVTAVFAGEQARRVIEREDSAIIEEALKDAAGALGIGDRRPAEVRVDRHPFGRPVITPGYSERIITIREASSSRRGLHFAGDWLHSMTLEGAVMSGIEAASRCTGSG